MKMHTFSVKMWENACIFYERPYAVGNFHWNFQKKVMKSLLELNVGNSTNITSEIVVSNINPFNTKPMAKIAVKMSIMRVVKFMSS